VLTVANVQGAKLATTLFFGVTSGALTGKPASLPSGDLVNDGYLFAPLSSFSGDDLSNDVLQNLSFMEDNLTNVTVNSATDFTGSDFTGANLTGSDFSSAILTSVTWADTTCPDTTNSNDDGYTCAGHLIP